MEYVGKSLKKVYDQFADFFWGIGYFGWQFATIYALIVVTLIDVNYTILFFVLFLFSGWLNHEVFKKIIHNLRPKESTLFLANETKDKVSNGMPSGHSQQTAFALTIAYLFSERFLYMSIALFGLTVLQRYIFKNHTLPQLLVGGVFGFLLGFVSFHVMRFLEKYLDRFQTKVFKKN